MEAHDAPGEVAGPFILPLCFLGNAFYYACLLSERGAVVDMVESYRKQTLRNRAEIGGPAGRQSLTIPVKVNSQIVPAQDRVVPLMNIKVSNQIWRSLKTAYGSAPFFIHVADELEPLIYGEYESLLQMNLAAHLRVQLICADIPDLREKNNINNGRDVKGMFKPSKISVSMPPYPRVYDDRQAFLSNLSIVDVMVHMGPHTANYLREAAKTVLHPKQAAN